MQHMHALNARVVETSGVSSKKFHFMFVHDKDKAFSDSFGNVKFTPTLFVIDKAGDISQKIVGGTLEEIKKIL